jgi:hypothetical protein
VPRSTLAAVRAAVLALLAAAASAPAAAQDAPPDPPRPPAAQRAALVAGGVVGGVVLVAVVSPTAATALGLVLTAAALPVGAAGGVHLAGRALGLEGSFQSGVGRATLGFGVAVAAASALVWASGLVPGSDGPCDVACTPQLVAGAAGVVTVFVGPAALAAPTGERALGLRLRVGL